MGKLLILKLNRNRYDINYDPETWYTIGTYCRVCYYDSLLNIFLLFTFSYEVMAELWYEVFTDVFCFTTPIIHLPITAALHFQIIKYNI